MPRLTLSPKIACFLLVSITLAVPALLGRGVLKADRFDESLVEDLNREKPQILLIGDSMLYTRLDLEALRQRATGHRISEYSVGGTATAAWYLYFKNVLLAAKRPPKTVVIFFRDDLWTQPHLRTTGARRDHLMELSRDLAGDLSIVPGFASDSWSLDTLPGHLYPVVNFRNYLRQRLVLLTQDIVTGTGSKYPLLKARREMFDLGNLRADLPAELPDAAGDGSEALEFDAEGTFLPGFFQLAREHGIRLVFYRVKRRPELNGMREETPELSRYIDGLRGWLEGQGGRLVDESGDPALTLDLYLDGDHLRESARPGWTKRFWDRLEPVIEGGGRP
jgi:hypothetical protein